jgi:hypothetical protein
MPFYAERRNTLAKEAERGTEHIGEQMFDIRADRAEKAGICREKSHKSDRKNRPRLLQSKWNPSIIKTNGAKWPKMFQKGGEIR